MLLESTYVYNASTKIQFGDKRYWDQNLLWL